MTGTLSTVLGFVACATAEDQTYGAATGYGLDTTSASSGSDSTATSDGTATSPGTATGPVMSAATSNTSASSVGGASGSSESAATETTGSTETAASNTVNSLSSAISVVTVNSASATGDATTSGVTGDATSTTATNDTTGATATSTTGSVDNCPSDPNKTEPGICDCGTPDTDANCTALANALVHRYSFDGTGTAVTDSVGSSDGTSVSGTQSGGSVSTGGSGYVDLPNGIVSSLSSITVEAWVTWSGGDAWQRIFDFGSSDMAEGVRGAGESYLFLTPQAVDTSGVLRAAFSTSGPAGETYVEGTAALTTGASTHVAVTVSASSLALFVNGASVASTAFSGSLASISDVNNWLGASQFDADPGFVGSFQEFRIYNTALSAAQLSASYALGPDVPLAE